MKKLGIVLSICIVFVAILFFYIHRVSYLPKNPPSEPLISYRDAAVYDGQVKTVEMPALYVFNNKKYLFISSRSNPHHAHMVENGGDKTGFFTVRIMLEDLKKFPPDFETTIKDKILLVTGKIGWYQGDPHIVVSDPSQIIVQ